MRTKPRKPARLGETLEAMEIETLLLEGPHESLDDAIALRLADVRRRDRHPQPLHLVDPCIGDVLRAPVAADPESAGDVLREARPVAYALHAIMTEPMPSRTESLISRTGRHRQAGLPNRVCEGRWQLSDEALGPQCPGAPLPRPAGTCRSRTALRNSRKRCRSRPGTPCRHQPRCVR